MGTVVDTVVLHYFLLADRIELLMELLQPPIGVPRIVYDPDDAEGSDETVSELRRNIRYEQRIARAADVDRVARDRARDQAARLQRIDHFIGGQIDVLDLTHDELDILARLTAQPPEASLGLIVPLGAGEAACIAVALGRQRVLATDDNDALRVLQKLHRIHPYERIRRLLIRASNAGLISEKEANKIHMQMRDAGFWDSTAPFP